MGQSGFSENQGSCPKLGITITRTITITRNVDMTAILQLERGATHNASINCNQIYQIILYFSTKVSNKQKLDHQLLIML